MRPEMGRAQLEQETVGMDWWELSQGRRVDGVLTTVLLGCGGVEKECTGRGLDVA